MSSVPLDADMQAAAQASRLREQVGGLLSGSQMERLLALWHECRTSQMHCSVPGFVDKLATELRLDAALAGQLRLKLFAEVLANRPAARRSAALNLAQPARPAAPRRLNDDAASEVFIALLGHLDALVGTRYADRWPALCAALVRQLRQHPVRSFDVGSLLRGEQPPAELALPVSDEVQRQALVHHYYLALCEVFGPTPADRLLSDAVKQAEQLAAAARYAPRRLL